MQLESIVGGYAVDGNTVMNDLLRKLRRAIQNKRRGMLTKGVVLLHDNARPRTAARTKTLVEEFKWDIYYHLPHRHTVPI